MNISSSIVPLRATSIKEAVAHRLALIDTHAAARLDTDGPSLESILVSEIDFLRDAMASFTRRLNEVRCLILRLPPEVLRLIFETFVQFTHHPSIYVERRPNEWIHLGHVCSRFRTVLLGMHTLWADIVFCRQLPGAHKELLLRAHDAPLFMHFMGYNYDHSMDAVNLASRYLSRSHTILASKSEAVRSFAHQLRSGSFPYLEYIDLRSHWRSEITPILHLTQAEEGLFLTTCSYHDFAANMPKLRHLQLNDVFIPFDASTLTTLWLSRPTDTLDMLPSRPFLEMLRRCTNVQELCLRDWIPEISISATAKSSIELPALQKLELTSDRARILELWYILRIPTFAVVDVIWRVDSDYASSVEGTAAFLRHVRAYNNARPLSRMEVSGLEHDGELVLSILTPCDDPDAPHTRWLRPHNCDVPTWSVALKVELYRESRSETTWSAPDIAEAIARFCTIFQFLTIAALDTSRDILRAEPNVYKHFSAVQTLCIEWPDADMLSALNGPPPASHPPGAILYPKLHSLSISTLNPMNKSEYQALYGLLLNRVQLGVPVQVLDLRPARLSGTGLGCGANGG
ncbi:hypothetical protein PENSPDRAFT_739746 [Peniophora sp. CONT]|nr:hypothetical protein PENSPDRAFT_739746 [Peniophora sp. CONT]